MARLARAWLTAVLACAGCADHTFKEPQKLGGKLVAPEVLNRGKVAYTQYCRACHGDRGDGRGPASYSYRPPPRDFTTGLFKFAAVEPGALPRDEDLRRIVQGGLHGTAMLAWELQDPDLDAIVQYLKIFSPRWRDELPGDPIVPSADPFGAGKRAEAVARGRKVYHGLAQCLACHPAYESKEDIAAAARELSGVSTPSFRAHPYLPTAKETDYTDGNAALDDAGQPRHLAILAPDFLYNEVRSVRDIHDLASSQADLSRVIASGISGTAMPQWRGALPEADLWALVYYVRSLIEVRDGPDATGLRARLSH